MNPTTIPPIRINYDSNSISGHAMNGGISGKGNSKHLKKTLNAYNSGVESDNSIIAGNSNLLECWLKSNQAFFSNTQLTCIYVSVETELSRISAIERNNPYLCKKVKKNISIYSIVLEGMGRNTRHIKTAFISPPYQQQQPSQQQQSNDGSNNVNVSSAGININGGSQNGGNTGLSLSPNSNGSVSPNTTSFNSISPNDSTNSLSSFMSMNSNASSSSSSGNGKNAQPLIQFFNNMIQKVHQPTQYDNIQYLLTQSIQKALLQFIDGIQEDRLYYNQVISYKKNEGMYLPTLYLASNFGQSTDVYNNNGNNKITSALQILRNNNTSLNENDVSKVPIFQTIPTASTLSSSPPTTSSNITLNNDIDLHVPIINNNNNNEENNNNSVEQPSKETNEDNNNNNNNNNNTDSTQQQQTTDNNNNNNNNIAPLSPPLLKSLTPQLRHSILNNGRPLLAPNSVHNIILNDTRFHPRKFTPVLTSNITLGNKRALSNSTNSLPLVPSINSSTTTPNSTTLSTTSSTTVQSPNTSPSNSSTNVTNNNNNNQNNQTIKITVNDEESNTESIPTTPTQDKIPQQPTFNLYLPIHNIDDGNSIQNSDTLQALPSPTSPFASARPTRGTKEVGEKPSMTIYDTPDGQGSAITCSLYGWDFEKKERNSEPFADCFCITANTHKNIKATLTIADGSGIGADSHRAATLAVLGANKYIEKLSLVDINTTGDLLTIIGNAILEGHRRIIEDDHYKNGELHIEPKGATTFCIGFLGQTKNLVMKAKPLNLTHTTQTKKGAVLGSSLDSTKGHFNPQSSMSASSSNMASSTNSNSSVVLTENQYTKPLPTIPPSRQPSQINIQPPSSTITSNQSNNINNNQNNTDNISESSSDNELENQNNNNNNNGNEENNESNSIKSNNTPIITSSTPVTTSYSSSETDEETTPRSVNTSFDNDDDLTSNNNNNINTTNNTTTIPNSISSNSIASTFSNTSMSSNAPKKPLPDVPLGKKIQRQQNQRAQFETQIFSQPSEGQWFFMVGTVGDSRAFRWSAEKKKVTEVTNLRAVRNFNDAGGQLGWMWGGEDGIWPYDWPDYPKEQRQELKIQLLKARNEKSRPHLRNLHFGLIMVEPGDRIFITSDGVTDNFVTVNPSLMDPQPLQQQPQQQQQKDEIEVNMTEFLKQQPPENIDSCESMCTTIITYCLEKTQQYRNIQEEMSRSLVKLRELEKILDPNEISNDTQYQQVKKNYSKLANSIRSLKYGKPDHSSIVMYQVPRSNQPVEQYQC